MTALKIAGVAAAVLLFGTGVYGTTTQTREPPRMVGQETPMPEATPTVVPAPNTTAPTNPSGTIDLKQGGIQGNSNGPSWLDKFNRNPGPDTSGTPARTPHTVMPAKVKKIKVRTSPVPPPH